MLLRIYQPKRGKERNMRTENRRENS
jgi:hypothetical protein